MAGRNKRFTEQQIASALRRCDGIIPAAARLLKTKRQVIHERIERSVTLQVVLTEIEEDQKTTARGNIAKALKKGDMPTTRWYAERKMRKEGFGTRIETGVDEAQVEAFIASLGGDIGLYRSALAAIEQPGRR